MQATAEQFTGELITRPPIGLIDVLSLKNGTLYVGNSQGMLYIPHGLEPQRSGPLLVPEGSRIAPKIIKPLELTHQRDIHIIYQEPMQRENGFWHVGRILITPENIRMDYLAGSRSPLNIARLITGGTHQQIQIGTHAYNPVRGILEKILH